MDAKFTILTNSTKGVIGYQNGAKIILIKIKYSILPLSQEEMSDFDVGIFSFST
jgi:hypothetical protein